MARRPNLFNDILAAFEARRDARLNRLITSRADDIREIQIQDPEALDRIKARQEARADAWHQDREDVVQEVLALPEQDADGL